MQPLRTIKKLFKLTRPLWKQLLKNIYTGSFAEKNLRIFIFFFRKRRDWTIFFQVSRFECPHCKNLILFFSNVAVIVKWHK